MAAGPSVQAEGPEPGDRDWLDPTLASEMTAVLGAGLRLIGLPQPRVSFCAADALTHDEKDRRRIPRFAGAPAAASAQTKRRFRLATGSTSTRK